MISSRKEEHVRLAVDADVGFRQRTNGLNAVELPYNALPELNLSEITPSTTLFGKHLALPLLISGMTGGYPDAERINAQLATCAARLGIGLGVGSMRAGLENPAQRSTFSVVKSVSHTVPIISNIGAVQLAAWHAEGSLAEHIAEVIEMIGASAFGIHLNPLQELLQPEGEPRFRGVLQAIRATVQVSPIPVLVKEVGAGIGALVGRKLVHAGVAAIDVGGAGGTSWAGVEIMRRADSAEVMHFWDVGIPTADCLRELTSLRHELSTDGSDGTSGISWPVIIASGGIANGGHIARAIALGANVCASARPILLALETSGEAGVMDLIRSWERELLRWMFLTGSANLHELTQCLHSTS